MRIWRHVVFCFVTLQRSSTNLGVTVAISDSKGEVELAGSGVSSSGQQGVRGIKDDKRTHSPRTREQLEKEQQERIERVMQQHFQSSLQLWYQSFRFTSGKLGSGVAMPPKWVVDQSDEGPSLDLVAINERLNQIVRDSQSSSQARDDHVIALEHRFQGAEMGINEPRGQFELLRESVNGLQTLLRDISARLPERQVEMGQGSQTGPGSDRSGEGYRHVFNTNGVLLKFKH